MSITSLVTLWNGNTSRITTPLWGESTGHPSNRASNMDIYTLFDDSLNKLLYKQSNGKLLKTLWRLCNVAVINGCVGICKTNDNNVVTATAFQFKQWPNDITICSLVM